MEADFYLGILRMLSALFLVVGLVYACVYLARKTIWKGLSTGQDVRIRVLGRHALGPKRSLLVVEVGGRRMLLGVTSDRISLLSHMEDRESADDDTRMQEPDPEPGVFQGILSGVFNRGEGVRSQ